MGVNAFKAKISQKLCITNNRCGKEKMPCKNTIFADTKCGVLGEFSVRIAYASKKFGFNLGE